MNADRFWYANETENIPAIWHYTSGILSLSCLLFGFLSNGLVIFLFIKNNVLRKPRNYFLINLAITDLGLLLTNNSLHTISAFKKKWIFGQIGCNFYAVCGGAFGLTSISTMAAISLTRLRAVNDPFSSLKLSSRSAINYLGFSWIYGSMWIMPPLFGWSRFILEGFGTTCTFDYVSKELSDRLFIIILVVGGFFIPLSIIVSSYAFILIKLSQRSRRLLTTPKPERYSTQQGITDYFNQLSVLNENQNNKGTATPLSFSDDNTIRSLRLTEARAARTALLICTVFCSAWGPYAFMTLLPLFGFDHLLNPYSTAILGIFTKVAACINPLIYALSLNGFRERIYSHVKHIYHCNFSHHEQLTSPSIKRHSTTSNTAVISKRTRFI